MKIFDLVFKYLVILLVILMVGSWATKLMASTKTIELGPIDLFAPKNEVTEQIQGLSNLILKLKKDGRLHIIMDINYGGNVKNLNAITNAIDKTDGTVIITCRTYCASAGAMLLFMGHERIIMDKAIIMFHLGQSCDYVEETKDWADCQVNTKETNKEGYDLLIGLFAQSGLSKYISESMFKTFSEGGEIIFYGWQINNIGVTNE